MPFSSIILVVVHEMLRVLAVVAELPVNPLELRYRPSGFAVASTWRWIDCQGRRCRKSRVADREDAAADSLKGIP